MVGHHDVTMLVPQSHSHEPNALWHVGNYLPSIIIRWDKYENKQLFWVEEDLKAEWEKSTTKSRRSEAEYQVHANAAESLASILDGVEMGPTEGGVWFKTQNLFDSVKILGGPCRYAWWIYLEQPVWRKSPCWEQRWIGFAKGFER